MTSRYTDRNYLLKEQYRDASNLDARIRLHELYSTNPRGWLPWVFDQFDLPPDAQILEVGCGPGTLWRKNRERIPPGWQVTLSDLSSGMLDEARAALADLGFRFERIDAQALPFADASFNAVIANQMLYHVPDQAKALGEFRRVLRPDGILYAATGGQPNGPTIRDWRAKAGAPVDPTKPTGGGSGLFTLENGGAKLKAFFTQVALHRYEDALEVREVEPLVDYVQSTSSKLSAEELPRFRALVAAEIAERGFLYIAKAGGMFVAK